MSENTLNPERRRELRAAAHHLNPVVAIAGNGLTPTVLAEIDRSLKAHELIKVKLHGIERDDRAALLDRICADLDCAPVQQIGNILVLWREKPAEDKPAPRKRSAKPMTKKQAAAAAEKPRRRTTRT